MQTATTNRTEIQRRRNEADLTQGQLAELAGLDPSTVSLIENGARQGHPTTLHRLAEAFGCDMADLLIITEWVPA